MKEAGGGGVVAALSPENAQKLERSGYGFSPGALRRSEALGFGPSETDSGLLVSRRARELTSVVLRCPVCANSV